MLTEGRQAAPTNRLFCPCYLKSAAVTTAAPFKFRLKDFQHKVKTTALARLLSPLIRAGANKHVRQLNTSYDTALEH